ncbi:YtxH domain-containing protein [Fulvivirgaceae bacterium BMA12]|uniref:YtxH domain-containing protein n=1 Tax=Agaribacillus aureus TaxID=3051825 RepID=A0ABT8LGA1_9BACT|nr:YtxH domain-containing protein [Fulvivirgaceae bacterium BMA12]
MSRSSNTFLAFLAGATTGALLGILYAPDKGSNTRDRLSYTLDKYKERLEDLLDDIINGKDETESVAKSKGERVVSDAKEKAEKLLHDVDELIDQIKGEDKE